MGLWAAVAQRDYLLGNYGGESTMLLVVKDIAFPFAFLTQIGIIIASMSQAIQCLIISPRLLQVQIKILYNCTFEILRLIKSYGR